MFDWKFRRRQGQCTACEVRFADGDRHVSALLIEGEELRREDHCLHCFGRRDAVLDLFFWYTRHTVGKRALQLDLATLEQLFVSLEGRPEPRVRELRYVLCLLLMRKRRLRLDRVVRGTAAEGEAMLLHRPRRKEVLKVFVFEFSPERLQVLKGELLGLLDGAEPSAELGEQADDARGDDDAGPGGTEILAGAADDLELAG